LGYKIPDKKVNKTSSALEYYSLLADT